MNAIPFPDLDPIAFSLGPIKIYWYGISYVVGILLGWLYARHLVKKSPGKLTVRDIDDFIVWATVGVIIGGRLGYVLFYNPLDYLSKPWEILYLWEPGRAFHGGLLGVFIAAIWFCMRRKLSVLVLGDILACATPIGLFFGRIANFVNAELYGRVTDVPWAVIFPTGGPVPRHQIHFMSNALGSILKALLNVTSHPHRQAKQTSRQLCNIIKYPIGRLHIIPNLIEDTYIMTCR